MREFPFECLGCSERAVADGDLARTHRSWAHTFVANAIAHAPGLMAAAQETGDGRGGLGQAG